jgi:uncharacterized protein YbjQ (UPF0145 family)
MTQTLADLALERLRTLRPLQNPHPFTSDLSVDEMVLARQDGFEPLGLVMGSAIYHLGFQWSMFNVSQELGMLTQAMYHARQLAMDRLESEAVALRADGVIGLRIEISFEHWGEGLAEFVAIGTAVRAPRPGFRVTAGDRPFTSDLSGQDFHALLQSGHRPLALVMGTCVYHVARQGLGAWFSNQGKNVELVNFTEALYMARELAMTRMQQEALRVRAQGVVGMRIDQKSHFWGGHTIEFLALGTAVAPLEGNPAPATPTMVVSLRDPV